MPRVWRNLLSLVLDEVELSLDALVFPTVEQFTQDDGLRVAGGVHGPVRRRSPGAGASERH